MLIDLNGEWELASSDISESFLPLPEKISMPWKSPIKSCVPGSVHTDLVNSGMMPDPFFADNAPKCRWPEEKSWWYKKSFNAAREILDAESAELIFEGLDHYAEIFLNGEHLGSARNSFRTHAFDVKSKLREENTLIVRLTSGLELARDEGIEGFPVKRRRDDPKRIWLRKPQYYFGWDWCEALPGIGIWRNVRIEAYSDGSIEGFRHIFKTEQSCGILEVSVTVNNHSSLSSRDYSLELSLISPEGEKILETRDIYCSPGLNFANFSIGISNPLLWWPNGHGRQNLYDLDVRLKRNGRKLACSGGKIGLRTIEIDETRAPADKRRFAIKINGTAIFSLGANWVPLDLIPAGGGSEKRRRLLSSFAGCGGNMLRVWGGGFYEDPEFYEICDRLGIMVWQDFMFACGPVPDWDTEYLDEVRREARWAVKTLRHHPCISIWCGNNENQWCIGEGLWFKASRIIGENIYSRILPEIVHDHSPEIPYRPGSPIGGDSPNSQRAGDMHLWLEGYASKDPLINVNPASYDKCEAPFISEFGVQGPPHMKSFSSFLPKDALDFRNELLKFHNNDWSDSRTIQGIGMHYANPDQIGMDDYILLGQLQQGFLLGYAIDSFRFRWPDCAGALIWMWNDSWPEACGWTPLDYYLRKKASYYFLKRSFRPVKVIARPIAGKIVARVLNNSPERISADLEYGWIPLDGSCFRLKNIRVSVPPGDVASFESSDIVSDTETGDNSVFVAILKNRSKLIDHAVWKHRPWREMKLQKPEFKIEERDDKLVFLASAFCHAVHFNDEGEDIFCDNYFDLFPGVPYETKVIGKIPIGKWEAFDPDKAGSLP